MKRTNISNNVIRRLPKYLRKLDELRAKGIRRVSSSELGTSLGLTSSQVRQDFSCFGEFGQQGYGYPVDLLRKQLAQILGMNCGFKAILVGAGNVGRALMDNFCFEESGVELCCAFDANEDITGNRNGTKVYHMDKLEQYLYNNHVDFAVLAVPGDAARETAKRLIDSGVNAIWNFTNTEIVEPNSDVLVENVHFSDSLLALLYYVSERKSEQKVSGY